MNVVLGSAFRNATGYATRYFMQVAALRDELDRWGHPLRLALAEGDSQDNTLAVLDSLLAYHQLEGEVADCTHGGPLTNHVASPVRMAELARVGNAILGQLTDADDVLLYVESDLLWDVSAMLTLLGHVAAGRADIAVPLVLRAGTNTFYDIWAYRAAGKAFGLHWPYSPVLRGWHPGALVTIETAGSCLAVNQAALRAARRIGFPAWDVWPGLCRALRGEGFRLLLDPAVRVEHPMLL